MTDISLDNYYYGEQFRNYIIQFMAIFGGLKVAIGKNDFNSQTNKIEVPILHGSQDRVVAAIKAENTQNKPIRVPVLSAVMVSLDIDPDLMRGTGQTQTTVSLPLGETLPDGLKVVKKRRPVPYRMGMELTIYASNVDQHLQMLEQILMLFDPTMQIQINDALEDWSKITTVTLEQIALDTDTSGSTSRRIITSTLQFTFPVYLSPPFDFKETYIKSVKLRLSALNTDQTFDDVLEDYETVIDAAKLDIPSV